MWILDNLNKKFVQYVSTSGRARYPNARKTDGLSNESRSKDLVAKIDALSNKVDQLIAARFVTPQLFQQVVSSII